MLNRSIILNSGGMDSFFVAHRIKAPHVFVDVGQKYAHKEVKSARRIAKFFDQPLIEMKASNFAEYEHESGIIPLRNAELILNAAQHGENIFLGVLNNEVNSDKSPEFFRAMEAVMDISCRAQYWSEGRTFKIYTPLGNSSKTTLVKEVQRYGGPLLWKAMLQTVSCYDGGEQHCGVCASCFKRWVALTAATGVDAIWTQPTGFVAHPGKVHPLSFWEAKNYPEERIAEIRAAYDVL